MYGINDEQISAISIVTRDICHNDNIDHCDERSCKSNDDSGDSNNDGRDSGSEGNSNNSAEVMMVVVR